MQERELPEMHFTVGSSDREGLYLPYESDSLDGKSQGTCRQRFISSI